MTGLWFMVRDHFAQRVAAITGAKVSAGDLERPPKPEMGDIALGCFGIAKQLNANPAEIAQKIVAEFGNDMRTIDRVEAAGPFVNIHVNAGEFIHLLIRDIEQEAEKYAASDQGKKRRILFEYAQPNTHKELHVGHLRMLILGVSLIRILRHAGWDVIPVSYHGDVGAHVAKCLWWLVEKSRATGKGQGASGEGTSAMDLTVEEVDAILASIPKEEHTGKYLGKLYTESTKEVEKDPYRKDVVSRVQQSLEADEPAWHKLWQETRRWSLEEFTTVFEELGVELERQYMESEVVDRGQEIVNELLEKGIAKESEGAIIVDCEDVGLGAFLIRKSDGTSLYATKDLALAELKKDEYPKMERSIMLVDNRQSLYFRQLFETLKRMGYDVPNEHVGFEFVTLKSGAMSSREGNIETYQDFREEVYQTAWKSTQERHKDWSQGQVNYTAWSIALAGMKFGMLRQDSEKIFTFDLEEALSFEGDTGPYVQYAVVRMNSILKKADYPDIRGKEEPDCRVLGEPQERELALQLARFSEVVEKSASSLSASPIAHWCVETAHTCNAFYRDMPVLEAEEGIRNARLRLVYAARDVLTLGLKLLGIPVPEEM